MRLKTLIVAITMLGSLNMAATPSFRGGHPRWVRTKSNWKFVAVSNAMAKSELTCAGTIEKLSISSDTLSARVFFSDSEGPGKSSFIKICSFSSNKGNISPAACASLYSDLKDKVSRNRIEFSFKKAKECSDLNGLWIESISL